MPILYLRLRCGLAARGQSPRCYGSHAPVSPASEIYPTTLPHAVCPVRRGARRSPVSPMSSPVCRSRSRGEAPGPRPLGGSTEAATGYPSQTPGELVFKQPGQQSRPVDTQQRDQFIEIVAVPAGQVSQHGVFCTRTRRALLDGRRTDLFQDIVHSLHELCPIFDQGVRASVPTGQRVAGNRHDFAPLFQRQPRRNQRAAPLGRLDDDHGPRESAN